MQLYTKLMNLMDQRTVAVLMAIALCILMASCRASDCGCPMH